jgi:uncharacterized protein YqgC (DUF456 family)
MGSLTESLCLFGGALGVMLLGLAGAFLPLIPGVPLVWLGAAGYGLLDGFEHLSLSAFVALTVVGAIGTTAEMWATQIGARAGGASGWSALAGSCLGGLALFFFSLPLALLAALAGVFGVELLRTSHSSGWQRGDVETAARGSGGWLAGWALSAVAQFSISVFMILFFLWAVVF